MKWVAASGAQGLTSVTITLADESDRVRPYTVRLHFSEPENLKAGERIFSVSIQGKQLLRNFDIVKAAGGANRAVVREFKGVRITDNLELSFKAGRGKALLCGIELVAE